MKDTATLLSDEADATLEHQYQARHLKEPPT